MKPLFLTLIVLFSLPVMAAFNAGRSGFSIIINNEVYPYHTFATFVLPGERLILRITDESDSQVSVTTGTGILEQTSGRRWTWTAPGEPGLTTISLTRANDSESIDLNVFVMVPSTMLENGDINGYHMGDYPLQPGDDPLYAPPDGFIEVTRANLATPVSPHFVLGQFVTGMDDQFPRYIVLRERLLLKLEALLERVNARGIHAESFGILTGYLSPALNATSGRDEYSRHIYGGAAVLIVDSNPADNIMDDLNNDDVIDDKDGRVIFELADELYQEADKSFLRGGLFLYGGLQRRGPAIMIDARGYRKRWQEDQDLFRDPARVKSTMETAPARQPDEFKN